MYGGISLSYYILLFPQIVVAFVEAYKEGLYVPPATENSYTFQ